MRCSKHINDLLKLIADVLWYMTTAQIIIPKKIYSKTALQSDNFDHWHSVNVEPLPDNKYKFRSLQTFIPIEIEYFSWQKSWDSIALVYLLC